MDTKADFAAYSTFAWLPQDSSKIHNILYDNQLISEKIKAGISGELLKRGLYLAKDYQTPDLLLQYSILVDEKQKILSYPQYSYVPITPNERYNPYLQNYTSTYVPQASIYPYDSNFNYLNDNRQAVFNSIYPYYNFDSPLKVYPSKPVITGNNFQQINYSQETVVIDVIDRKTMKLIWRGWCITPYDSPIRFKNEMGIIISYIFQKFPLKEEKPNALQVKASPER